MPIERVREILAHGISHLEFCIELYRIQIQGGRYFLHEHPETAGPWQHRCTSDLIEIPSVSRVRGDQCQYGAVAPHGPEAG